MAKTHGTGTTSRHRAKERRDLLARAEKRRKRLLKQRLNRQRKKSKKLVEIIRRISAPEILREWARKEGLAARKLLRERRIRPFTFYCRLLALDAIFSKRQPKKKIKVGKNTYALGKRVLLDETQKRDIREKLNEIGVTTAAIRKEVHKQERNMRKTLPKSVQKSA